MHARVVCAGLDVSNRELVDRIARKYAEDMFSDPHDPEYISRVPKLAVD